MESPTLTASGSTSASRGKMNGNSYGRSFLNLLGSLDFNLKIAKFSLDFPSFLCYFSHKTSLENDAYRIQEQNSTYVIFLENTK